MASLKSKLIERIEPSELRSHPRMAWPVRHRMRQRRRGSMIVEAVVSAALLGTATFALARLAVSASALTQQSSQRLAVTLIAENVLERLSDLPHDQIVDEADAVAKQIASETACDVQVATEPFQLGDDQGLHIRVEVSSSPDVAISLHDWRLPTADDASSDRESSSSRENADSNETEDSSENGSENTDETTTEESDE